jgi:hypothetical protein
MGEIKVSVATEEGKYIYCIIEAGQSHSFGPLGIGGRGDELYAVCFEDIAAVVSDAPIKRYTVSREHTLAHEKAIEKVMADHTVLPVRFATVAEDEEKVKRILEKEHHRFREALNRMRGRKELSLKAIFKEDVVYGDILEEYEDIKALKEKVAALRSDKTHYLLVQAGQMVKQALDREREQCKDGILGVLRPLAEDVKTNDTYGELMIVNAAFLVEKEKEADFDCAVEQLAAKYDRKIKLKYVGTLPPFNFVNLVIHTEEY